MVPPADAFATAVTGSALACGLSVTDSPMAKLIIQPIWHWVPGLIVTPP
jgi:hypothetical protein